MTRTYLVECYWPGVTEQAYADSVARAGRATQELARSGLGTWFVGSLFVPVDETVFYRFAGQSVAEVEQVCTRAELPFGRILECLDAADTHAKSPHECS